MEQNSDGKKVLFDHNPDGLQHDRLAIITKEGEIQDIADMLPEEEVNRIQDLMNRQQGRNRFMVIYQTKEGELARDLSPRAYRMLGYLKAFAGYNNEMKGFTHEKAMKFLGIKSPRVSFESIKELLKKKVISRVHREGTMSSFDYTISDSVCWKGSLFRKHKNNS